MAVPTSISARSDDDLLHHRFSCVSYINLPAINRECNIGWIGKTCSSENVRVPDV